MVHWHWHRHWHLMMMGNDGWYTGTSCSTGTYGFQKLQTFLLYDNDSGDHGDDAWCIGIGTGTCRVTGT